MADLTSSPEQLAATLGAEMEAAKAAHLADRDNPDKAAAMYALMADYTAARQDWRRVGEANGTRVAGAYVQNNTEG